MGHRACRPTWLCGLCACSCAGEVSGAWAAERELTSCAARRPARILPAVLQPAPPLRHSLCRSGGPWKQVHPSLPARLPVSAAGSLLAVREAQDSAPGPPAIATPQVTSEEGTDKSAG